MRKHQIICDACGKVVPPHETRYEVEISGAFVDEIKRECPNRGRPIIQEDKRRKLDYCKFCFTGPIKAALQSLTYTIEE